MSFTATPMFPGDFQDSAARLAASVPAAESARDTVAPASSGTSAAAAAVASGTWQQMQALGWQAVLVPEDFGGAGGSLADLASIVEATARHALVVPLIDRCAVAPALLVAAAARPAAHACLEAVAAGDASACAVLVDAATPPRLDAAGVLHGRLQGADLGEPASHLLLEARDHHGDAVVLLLASADLQLQARRFVGVDGRVSADLLLEGVACAPEAMVLRGAAALQALALGRQLGSVLTCVQAIAAAGAMIEQTIAYLNARTQFGAVLASFQSLRHRVVEMYVAYENGRGLVRELVLADAAGSKRERDVAMARLYVDDIGRRIAESAIQLHGGMGMSRETLAARIAVQNIVAGLRYGGRAQTLDMLAAHALDEA